MDPGEDANMPERQVRSYRVGQLLTDFPVPVNEDIRRYYFPEDNASTDCKFWAKRPEFPTSEELMGIGAFCDSDNSIYLSPNIISGAWTSKEAYLRTHYELLREDAVAPLRDAIAYVKENPQVMDSGSVSIYEKVYIIGVTFSQRGAAFRVQFCTRRAGKNVVWDYSKRLLSGSIVALSPANDCFQSKCIVAVVAARSSDCVKENPPKIDLYYTRPEYVEFNPHKEWIMVESRTGYYESARHTLLALQRMSKESFPFADYICSLSSDMGPPQYIKNAPILDVRSAFEQRQRHMVNVLDGWPRVPANSSLDTSQWAALAQILTRKLAIIQGPPGTGKTFVSATALRILLANKLENDPPIIVAAQTNHALDQLLAHISSFEKSFIRLGGRSNDPDIKRHTLYATREGRPVVSTKGGLLGPSRKSFQALSCVIAEFLQAFNDEAGDKILPLSFFRKHDALTEEQCISLEAGAEGWVQVDADDYADPMSVWLGDQITRFDIENTTENFGFSEDEIDLEYEQLRRLEAEQRIGGDDCEILTGQYSHIKESFSGAETGFNSKKAIAEYTKYHDLWKVPLKARGAVYNALRNTAKEKITEDVRKLLVLYNLNCENLQIGKWEKDYFILRQTNVIGMTTTGLSKYRGLISSLEPRIALIEEAGVAIEATVSAVCFESLQHLILVGDHKQLKGSCAVRDLTGEPFFLDVSMFERLVHNGMKYVTLQQQRRMAPEISRLLEPIYGKLQDHPTVHQRQNIPGMGDVRSYFFSHSWPESSDSLLSKVNETEAEMIAAFYVYLIMNSVAVSDITVLTFYNGQRKRLLKLLKQSAYLQGHYVKVATVDSYQGEENEIVILSLVRSGSHGSVGFLSVENRACVALSRAKRGFYIFGNAESLALADPLWWTVLLTMGGKTPEERKLGFYLPLTCVMHGRKTFLLDPQGFNNLYGGCDRSCNQKLECGHSCPILCHSFPHEQVRCSRPCRIMQKCGHRCGQICSLGHRCLCPHKCLDLKEAHGKLSGERSCSTGEGLKSSHERHKGTIDSYQAFANGGAKEQDRRIFAIAQNRNARCLSHAALTGAETGTLVDLGYEATATAAAQSGETFAAGYGNENLLD